MIGAKSLNYLTNESVLKQFHPLSHELNELPGSIAVILNYLFRLLRRQHWRGINLVNCLNLSEVTTACDFPGKDLSGQSMHSGREKGKLDVGNY